MSEQLPPEATLDMLYEVAMSCETQPEAQACLARLVDTLVRFKGMTAEAARKDVLDTLGYTAAYGSHDQRLRIERLFGAVHPLLGSAEGGPVSPAVAFAVGQRLAREEKGEKPQ